MRILAPEWQIQSITTCSSGVFGIRNALHNYQRNLGKRIYVKFFKIPCVIQLIFKNYSIKYGSMLRYGLTKLISWFPDSQGPDVKKRASLCFFAKLLWMKPQRCDLTAKWNREKKNMCKILCQDLSKANTFQAKQQNNSTMQLNTVSYLSLIRSQAYPHADARQTISSIVIIGSDLWHTPSLQTCRRMQIDRIVCFAELHSRVLKNRFGIRARKTKYVVYELLDTKIYCIYKHWHMNGCRN